MNALLSPPPGPVVQAWVVQGRRVNPDGSECSVFGTSFGPTEERARANWIKLWGKGLEWPVAELTFTREGGAQ